MCAYDSNYLVFLSFSDRCGSKLNKIRITCFNRGHTNFWLKIGRCPLHSHGCPVYWNNSVIINWCCCVNCWCIWCLVVFWQRTLQKCDVIQFLFCFIWFQGNSLKWLQVVLLMCLSMKRCGYFLQFYYGSCHYLSVLISTTLKSSKFKSWRAVLILIYA